MKLATLSCQERRVQVARATKEATVQYSKAESKPLPRPQIGTGKSHLVLEGLEILGVVCMLTCWGR